MTESTELTWAAWATAPGPLMAKLADDRSNNGTVWVAEAQDALDGAPTRMVAVTVANVSTVA